MKTEQAGSALLTTEITRGGMPFARMTGNNRQMMDTAIVEIQRIFVDASGFLGAWCQGAERFPAFFTTPAGGLSKAAGIEQIRPVAIDQFLAQLDGMCWSDRVFLGTMLSFYNTCDGRRVLDELGAPCTAEVAAALHPELREILAALIRHHAPAPRKAAELGA